MMSITDWRSNRHMESGHLVELFRNGIRRPQQIPSYILGKLKEYPHLRKATNVYERDWDLLILLDCARPDMMREVKDEYEFLHSVEELTSVGSCSMQWMDNTFTRNYNEEIKSTLHITSNTSSEAYLSDKPFQFLEEVWRDGWDEEIGTIPAQEVTDRAIYHMRESDAKRNIVHYMQPHLPFVTRPDINSNVVTTRGVVGRGKYLGGLHKEEGYSKEELWKATLENLRYVLDSVEVLISNVDADLAIISADHGEAFGEQGIWNHPCRTYIDCLIQVPWCPTSAIDSGNHNPDYEPTATNKDNMSLDDKLEALGYK